tara:strand:+ start:1036 stop:1611 length:576 start_codon:yes stop_codon:yes gene_type:complete
MVNRLVLRIFFTTLILAILLFIILKFSSNEKQIGNNNVKNVIEKTENSNVIKDVSYKSKSNDGSEYNLEALEGIIDQNNSDIIYLTTINAFIKLKDGKIIIIKSKFGKYNIKNFDTIFSKNVIIKYLNNEIKGEYLEFSLDKNLMIISKNVIFNNDKSSLKADVIEVDIKTKDIKVSMYEKNKKINIKSLK